MRVGLGHARFRRAAQATQAQAEKGQANKLLGAAQLCASAQRLVVAAPKAALLAGAQVGLWAKKRPH